MAKNTKSMAEQLAEKIDTTAAIENEMSVDTQALTPELVEDRIMAVVAGANHIFFDPEQRVKGSNGYLYRLDYDGWDSRDDGATSTGEIVVADRLSFLGNAVARGVCQALDNMLNAPARGRFTGGLIARGEALRARIKDAAYRGYSRGQDNTDELADLERKLMNNIEQVALAKIALHKACEAYHAVTGKVYETAQDKAQNAEKAKASVDPAQAARLAALGVSL